MISRPRSRQPRRFWIAACLPTLVVLAGCGSGDPPRFDLSGTVTYNGKPVPAGYLVFASDTTAENVGPGAQAEIHDGKYRTPPGLGTVGGPHVVSIYAFDGKPYQEQNVPVKSVIPLGLPLFKTVTMKVDLPREAAKHDFAVPAQ